jgi:hypothetical protein
MRVLESASWRPILKNLTLLDVARFREQIEEVNLIGVIDPDSIFAAVRDSASRSLQPLPTAPPDSAYGNGLPRSNTFGPRLRSAYNWIAPGFLSF